LTDGRGNIRTEFASASRLDAGEPEGEAEGADGDEAKGSEETLNDVDREAIPTKSRRKECGTLGSRHSVDVTRRGYEGQARRDLDEVKFGVNEMALAGLP
jgi:hypothetical protein